MIINKFSFTEWLAGPKSVSFTLSIGVIFLVTNYQHIIYNANPDRDKEFAYTFLILVLISHIDSLFFGMTTAIMMFQARKKNTKILYCVMEGIMIFLNLNQKALSELYENHEMIIRTYIAIFGAFSFYFLGTLMAEIHNSNEKRKREIEEEEKAINESLEVNNTKK